MKNQGPRLTVVASCFDCADVRSERYVRQSDSGSHVSCAHPDGKGRIGDTTWETPEWCPLLAAAREALVVGLRPPAPAPKALGRCGVAAIVTDGTGRLLLVRSRKPGRAWELPGGKVHEDEWWTEALVREVREETGLEITIADEPPRVRNGKRTASAWTNVNLIARAHAKGEPVPGDDAAEAQWFTGAAIPLDDLSDLASADDIRYWAHVATEVRPPAAASAPPAKPCDECGGSRVIACRRRPRGRDGLSPVRERRRSAGRLHRPRHLPSRWPFRRSTGASRWARRRAACDDARRSVNHDDVCRRDGPGARGAVPGRGTGGWRPSGRCAAQSMGAHRAHLRCLLPA